ncbi:MAG: 1-deoxy-D-xylulose-5-phosphate synthase [Eubacterium sp.]|nr:1-deoxy-D-xylulose-5-phosphate synthase [Eubacterium sp.]
MILDEINNPNDIKNVDPEDLDHLAREIRHFIIEHTSKNGGHLASNLGAVELTMALHLFLDFPQDKLVFDVGHQCYTHKILTGRKNGFDSLRKLGGLSGFPKRGESDCDSFNTGHSSTSVSAALGLAQARDLSGEDYRVVAVIGDGALTGGMAYEALNNAANLTSNFIIVLNDNEMSISENVGGLSKSLSGLRTAGKYKEFKDNVERSLLQLPGGEAMVAGLRRTKRGIKQVIIPEMFFEDLGITYVGPCDGHNISEIMEMLSDAARVDGPVLVHVKTKKGRGYLPAERHPARFHGTDKFDIETGLTSTKGKKSKYTDIFSTVMRKFGDREPKVCAITAAMADGTGLKRFRNMFPDRFFDVGICEEHAVTFAAGLSVGGYIPVVAIYSSFLQRAYDQVVEDVCLQNLHVIFAIDRAGLVGSDGETHHGIFDISFLSAVPNMTLMAPKNKWELSDMLKYAVTMDSPVAIRYPRGAAFDELKELRAPVEYGKSEELYSGKDIVLFAYGSMVKQALITREALATQGLDVTLVNARFAKPIDEDAIRRLAGGHSLIVTMEEGILSGGLGDRVREFIDREGIDLRILAIGIDDRFVGQGSCDELFRLCRIDGESVAERVVEEWKAMAAGAGAGNVAADTDVKEQADE